LLEIMTPLLQECHRYQELPTPKLQEIKEKIRRVPKLATPLASCTLNSVWSSWISTNYRTLQYLNNTYRHTIIPIISYCIPCVLSVSSSLWRQSLPPTADVFTLQPFCYGGLLSVGVSVLGVTGLPFVNTGVKINGNITGKLF